METAGVLPLDEGFCVGVLELPPMDEKFHLPLGSFSIITCGLSITMLVTFTCCEKISGIISTPTFSDFAVRNGPELNFGSSATERLSTPSEPLISDKLSLPSSTLRPSASLAFCSIVGRNLSTGIRNGAISSSRINTTITIPIHFRALLMVFLQRQAWAVAAYVVRGWIIPQAVAGLAQLQRQPEKRPGEAYYTDLVLQ